MSATAQFLHGSCPLAVNRPYIAARYARCVARASLVLIKMCLFSCTKKIKDNLLSYTKQK